MAREREGCSRRGGQPGPVPLPRRYWQSAQPLGAGPRVRGRRGLRAPARPMPARLPSAGALDCAWRPRPLTPGRGPGFLLPPRPGCGQRGRPASLRSPCHEATGRLRDRRRGASCREELPERPRARFHEDPVSARHLRGGLALARGPSSRPCRGLTTSELPASPAGDVTLLLTGLASCF